MQREVIIDPLVAAGVLDHCMRLPAGHTLEGFLLGGSVRNVTRVWNFVPRLDVDFLRLTMRGTSDLCVGWYISESEVAESETQRRIEEQVANPVLLTIRTPLDSANPSTDSVAFRCYQHQPVTFSFAGPQTGAKFYTEIPCKIECSDMATTVAMDTICNLYFPDVASSYDPARVPTTAGDDPYAPLRKLIENLQVASEYIDAVVKKKIVGEKAIGRSISQLLSSIQRQVRDPAAVGQIDEKTQDALMLQYIARLMQNQIHALTAHSQPSK